MAILKPKVPSQTPLSGYTTGPTPVADFVEKVVVGIVMVVMGPVFAAILICGPAILLVYGIGGVTGLTAAWAELVLQVSTVPVDALSFSTMLLQNLACGAIISLLLALPAIRRTLERYNLRNVAQQVGTSTAVAALQLSAAAILLHLTLGLLVAAVMTFLGMTFPMPFGQETVIAKETLAFFFVSGGAGGTWPPTVDQLSLFAIFALSMMIFAGAVFGSALWIGLGFVAQRLAPASAAEAASEGASALGTALSYAVTKGEEARLYYDWRSRAVWTGLAHGALTGAIYAGLVLAGAAVLGVG